jgi:tetratricopeptide (TPR) repeat protein
MDMTNAVRYPAGKEALSRGYLYRWEVTDPDSRPVVTGEFLVATESELKQMEELKPLAAGEDRADLLAAALSYRRLGCYAEAIAAFERLAKLAPDAGVYRDELAELYRQAGRPGDGEGGSRGAAK